MRPLLVWIAISALAAVVLLIALPGERALVLDIWFPAAGALAVLATLRATVGRLPAEQPSPIDELPGADEGERPKDLAELESIVALAATSEFDLYFRLRPRLRRIAAAKLRAHGIGLEASADGASAALGPTAWDILRPDRPRPDPTASGRNLSAIGAVADALERL